MPVSSIKQLNAVCLKNHGFSLKRSMFFRSISHDYYGMVITQVNIEKAPIGVVIGNHVTGVNDILFTESQSLQAVLRIINSIIPSDPEKTSDINLSLSTENNMLQFNIPLYRQQSLLKNGFLLVDTVSKFKFISEVNLNHSWLCNQLKPGNEIIKINDIDISGLDKPN